MSDVPVEIHDLIVETLQGMLRKRDERIAELEKERDALVGILDAADEAAWRAR